MKQEFSTELSAIPVGGIVGNVKDKAVYNAQGRAIFFRALFLYLLLSCPHIAQGQKIAEKTNLLGWATLSPNLGTEFVLSRHWSFDASLSYQPWKISESTSLRHWLVSPEIRLWNCRVFEGSFIGLHLLAGQFNVKAIPLTGLPKDNEYSGFLAGGGVSYGYHLPLSARWAMELTAGAGYVWIDYDRYECRECREKIAEGTYSYFGLTRLGVSLIYFLQ
jgi:hypothetical protein